jgi:rhodanese-related sulfurtransferase
VLRSANSPYRNMPDAETAYHNPELRKDRPIILYCASGGRSALSGKVLKDMGYEQVYNLGAL